MSRLKLAALAFCVVGGLAAASVSERTGFVIAFFWLMFGGIAAAVVLVAAPRAEVETPKHDVSNPFTDELGVQRYPGDVLDLGKR